MIRLAITVAGAFLSTLATVASGTGAELPPLKIRQMIIRVPEEKFLQALEARPTDDALSKQLYTWLDSGAAKLVRDNSTTATPGTRFETKEGTVYKWVTENDQDWEGIPKLMPTSWEDVFLGTTLEGEYPAGQWEGLEGDFGPTDPFSGKRMKLDDIPGGKYAVSLLWRTETRSRLATKVPWPLVWPENKTPAVGLYEQDDFLAQTLITSVRVLPGRDAIVGFIRPASDMERESKPSQPELDVMVAQVRSNAAASPSPSSRGKESPAPPRVQFFGFGVANPEALALLAARESGNDTALLSKLHAMAREKKAIRRLACGSAVSSSRTTLTSVREHHFPTEMPTIPSAWDTRPVGVSLEMELINRALTFSLRLDPARFRWAQWDCALDAPELIMRQPQFYQQQVDATCEFREGQNVVLVGTMTTPECLKSADANAGPVIGETLLLFAELYQPEGTPPLKVLPQEQDPQDKQLDLEAVVFELPASERAAWEGQKTEGVPTDDESRFQKALAKVQDGTASIVCHLSSVTNGRRSALVQNIEQVTFVTEYNPVDHNPYGRYRPTALEASSVGSSWNVDVLSILAESEFGSTPVIRVASALHHDTQPAVLPTLKESLEYTRTHQYDLPKPTFTAEEWTHNLILLPGKAQCLGIRQTPDAMKKDRIHVAFVRARVRP
ncbi:hypothetical protein [Roseimicrobium sp. ORNL1]|uniref:hypothetical protein n=1 Tax=Roseimicrobium sp. ORNL1 TaxID=2711231 RepID=UPI0013E1AB78|nr:hypothetical protein [Roseimicrobium sp. ORNL1]QIF02459.1 hypothetical protein G5S37_13295 [Roseimicrobium sp. ORNL1]